MSNTISFKHSGNTGDILYALAGMKHVCEKYGKKAKIYLWLDRKGFYYEGAKHPLGDFIFTDHMYKRLKPLLLTQPWVHSVKKYVGQDIQIDLDLVRQRNVNMPYGHIARWYFYIFADMACDLSLPWLEIPVDPDGEFANTIIVNRTSRYRNPHIAYSFLRKYQNVVFVGTKEEYESMLKEVPNMKFVNFPDFYTLAIAIKTCKVFIGNQSMCYALAEAMKAPRILEVCAFAPNCIPEGAGPAYDFLSQSAFEHYVEVVVGEKKQVDTPKNYRQSSHEFDWSKGRFQQGINGGWVCQMEDMDIVKNTLVDSPRLAKIEQYVKLTEDLPGAICEVGVYKGGTALLIRKTTKKMLYLVDTFEGMPEVDATKDLHHTGDFADTSLNHVALLLGWDGRPLQPDIVHVHLDKTEIYKARFPSALVTHSMIELFSFVHIDVDIYQSVKDCLEYFYPMMAKGGIIAVDDYNEPNCPGAKQAFDEFIKDKHEGKGWRNGQWDGVGNNNLFMDCQSQRAFIKL